MFCSQIEASLPRQDLDGVSSQLYNHRDELPASFINYVFLLTLTCVNFLSHLEAGGVMWYIKLTPDWQKVQK